MLQLAVEEARSLGAVYGLPDVSAKRAAGKVAEDEWLAPITMYGCNKLYC